MPRKSCCCNSPPPTGGSCCRPIYSGCVGKEYEFSVLMKIKYPCYKTSTFVQKEFVCPNNPAIVYPIQNNLETFRLTVKYRITEPAYQTVPAACAVQYNPTRRCDECDTLSDPFFCTNNCGDAEAHPITPVQSIPCGGLNPFGVYPFPVASGNLVTTPTSCLPQSFLPSNYLTWPLFGNPISGCDCFNGKYPTCDFSELKPCDQLNTGFLSGLYRCEGLPGDREYLPGQTPVCPDDPFGNPTTVVIIREPVEPNFFHANCYNYWRLQKPNFGFIPYSSGIGCTITNHGEVDISNVADSYTIQFIPDPNVPEQNNPNYTPKIQPKLIFFQVLCNKIGAFNNDGFGIREEFLTPTNNNNNDNYGIFLKMGFGYRAEFCCDTNPGSGGGPNPLCNNIEVVDIPFREFKNWFDGTITSQGMRVFMAYGRSSLPNDPINLCIPTSTQNVPNLSCTPQTCDTGSAYYDDYNACYKGNPTVGFSVSDPQDPFDPPNPNLWIYNDYCDPIFNGDVISINGWPLCNHVRFDYRIDVDRTV